MPKAPMARLCLGGIVVSCCLGGAGRAEGDADAVAEDRARLVDTLEFGGHVEFAWERLQNFDLDAAEADDLHLLGAELQLELEFDPNAYVDAVVQLTLSQEADVPDQGGAGLRQTEIFVEEAHVTLSQPDWGLSLQLGRQPFEDVRQWWYDADLDGIRATWRGADLALEASASREALVQADLLNPTREEAVDNYILHGAYVPVEGVAVAAYAIVSDHQDGDRPVFVGLQSFGTVLDRLAYWVDAALVRGEEDDRDLRGWGLDVAAAYHFAAPLAPRLILGYAFGSGDADPDDGSDGAFRQTGLQDNEAAIGGPIPFRYYGEALDPELSNMSILSAGVGLSPSEAFAVDLVYHHYVQDHAADELRDSALDAEPSGESRRLGREIDLVLGFAPLDKVELRGFLGYFMPGRAFGAAADDALFLRLEAEYAF